ncbi:MAG: DNA polymerase, partial [Lactobacillus iners]|nr:DNA polymerase [Lactobacillus iners]
VNDLEIYTPKHMQEVYGVTPKQFIDVKALMGDASDNYPGVEKVGAKTASKLINQYGSVENLYEKIAQVKASKIKEYLIRDKNNAILGKKLATIDCTSPVDLKIDDVELQAQQLTQLRSFYERLGFKKFLSELPDVEEIDNKVQDECHYEILDKDNLSEIFATDFDHISFNLEMIGDNYHLAQYAGFSVKIKQKIYVCDDVTLLQEAPLKKILEDKNIAKQVFDLKRNYVGLQRLDITLSNVTDDIMLASYIADSENNARDIGVLANSYQESYVQSDEIIYGKGKKQHSVDVDTLYAHMATKVDVLDKLKAKIMPELQQHEQVHLYKNIEIPIAVILTKMEIAGIKVQATTLVKMKNDLDVRITDLKNKIYQLAGEKFNINSPKQLGVILFEKLKLTPAKKTKTGYSTSVDVLEKLKYQSPIVDDILDYRQISKIQSTY